MKFGAIIAARMGSARLPGKALMPLKSLPMVVFLIRRLRDESRPGLLHFATTTLAADDELVSVVAAEGVPVFRGANADVMRRYVDAARVFDIDYVVRVTADCPFVDAETLSYCLKHCDSLGRFDLATTKGLFPVGIDFEIYDAAAMRKLHESACPDAADREHLTRYFYNHSAEYTIHRIAPAPAWTCADQTFTVDTAADYARAQNLVSRFDDIHFSVASLIREACG